MHRILHRHCFFILISRANELVPPILEQKEEFLKRQKAEQEALKKFRETIEEKVNSFIKDGSITRCEFEPMDKVHRSIV